jgi:hypothetical protein
MKATYGTSGVGIRVSSHDTAAALIVIRLSRDPGVEHETVYNGALDRVAGHLGPLQKNGQAQLGLARLRVLNASVPEDERVPRR